MTAITTAWQPCSRDNDIMQKSVLLMCF